MSEVRYISCADTAKLVRKALKHEFPRIKFSVRSKTYAGGASINVGWTDGPRSRDVANMTRTFEGADFDPSIDLRTVRHARLLPDGSAAPVESNQGELVSFGADYIFPHRELTTDVERVARDLCALQHVEFEGLHMHGLLGDADHQCLDRHAVTLLARTTFAPGEVYAGIRFTPDDPDTGAWCGIVTVNTRDDAPDSTEELEAAADILTAHLEATDND